MDAKCFFKGFIYVAIYLLLAGFAVMLLWNAVIPDVFSVTHISYPQSLLILVLARILFGHKPGFMHGKGRGMHAKWHSMSEEERMEFRRKWEEKCCKPKDGNK